MRIVLTAARHIALFVFVIIEGQILISALGPAWIVDKWGWPWPSPEDFQVPWLLLASVAGVQFLVFRFARKWPSLIFIGSMTVIWLAFAAFLSGANS